MARKSKRKIVVDGIQYTWMVGKRFVEIRGPDQFKLVREKRGLESEVRAWGYYDDYDTANIVMPIAIRSVIRSHVEGLKW